jgi:multiple sugar transport system substrate-binding protein
MNKNIFSVPVSLLCMISLCFTGCGAKAVPVTSADTAAHTAGTAAPVSLQYDVWEDELPYAEKAADAFNALHNDIQVRVCSISESDYEINLKASLDSGDKIDLFSTKGMASLIQLVESGKVLDISDRVKQGIKDGTLNAAAYGAMFNSILYQNCYYALPSRTTCWELYYNKDIFDKAGIAFPGQMTWAEYAALAKRLTSGTGDSKVYGGYWVDWIPNFLALQHGSYLTDDDLTYARQSLSFLQSLYATDRSHVSFSDMKNADDPNHDVYTQFEDGKVAMVPQGEWMVNELISSKTDVNWEVAPMPIDDGEDAGTTVGQYQFVSISSSCSHPEEAYTFMQFLCGKEGAEIYAQNAILPAYQDADITEAYLKITGKESTRIFLQAKKYIEQPPVRGYQECIVSYFQQAEKYFYGKESLDEAMQQFEAERSSIYSSSALQP